MTMVIADVGEQVLLRRVLYEAPTDLTLKLFSNNVTPAEGDTAGTYTEATFTGYAAKTLTASQSGGTWAAPSTSTGTTSSTYGTAQSWSPTSSQTVYGYFIVNASGTLVCAELFASPRALVSGDTLTITPRLEAA